MNARGFLLLLLDQARARPRLASAYLIGSALHTFGHLSFGVAVQQLLGVRTAFSAPALGTVGRLFGASAVANSAALIGAQGALVLALGAVLIRGSGHTIASYAEVGLAGQVATKLRHAALAATLARQLVHDPGHADQRSDVADSSARTQLADSLTAGIVDVEQALLVGVLVCVRALGELAPLLALLALLAPRLALLGICTAPLLGWLLRRTRGGAKRAAIALQRDRARVLGASVEALAHQRIWRAYGAEAFVLLKLDAAARGLASARARLAAWAASLSVLNEVLALALLLGMWQFAPTLGATPATVVAFCTLFFLAYKPLRALSEARLAMHAGALALTPLVAVFGTFAQLRAAVSQCIPAAPTAAEAPALGPGALVLEKFASALPSALPLSMRIESGELVVICGPSGSGKTSLLEALLGLRAGSSGRAYFETQVGSRHEIAAMSGVCAWVPQAAQMLEGSIADNVHLGSSLDAAAALRAIGAPRLALRADEPAHVLSGGERAQVAIARAYATARPVLLLDEPFAHCDAERAAVLWRALCTQRATRTVLLVSHDPAHALAADRVIRLDAA